MDLLFLWQNKTYLPIYMFILEGKYGHHHAYLLKFGMQIFFFLLYFVLKARTGFEYFEDDFLLTTQIPIGNYPNLENLHLESQRINYDFTHAFPGTLLSFLLFSW